MIYGYDTQLHGSESFQDIEALGSTLLSNLDILQNRQQVSISPVACHLPGPTLTYQKEWWGQSEANNFHRSQLGRPYCETGK